uniref:Uncharacterized protein n=1 Tax=Ditylenchus dipsaci TaxID=166011 RepID=A0A915EI28_9BILA
MPLLNVADFEGAGRDAKYFMSLLVPVPSKLFIGEGGAVGAEQHGAHKIPLLTMNFLNGTAIYQVAAGLFDESSLGRRHLASPTTTTLVNATMQALLQQREEEGGANPWTSGQVWVLGPCCCCSSCSVWSATFL